MAPPWVPPVKGAPNLEERMLKHRYDKRWSMEAEQDLVHFLKISHPEWSEAKRKGGRCRSGRSNCIKILDKLFELGVYTAFELADRIEKNTLNDHLAACGYVRWSREECDAIRGNSFFIKSLESVDAPFVREVGTFSSVPQMLAKKRIITEPLNCVPVPRPEKAFAPGEVAASPAGASRSRNPASGQSVVRDRDIPFDAGGELKLRGANEKVRKPKVKRRPGVSIHGMYPELSGAFGFTDDDGASSIGSPSASTRLPWEPEAGFWSEARGDLPKLGSTPSSDDPNMSKSKSAGELNRTKKINFSAATEYEDQQSDVIDDSASFSSGPTHPNNGRSKGAKATFSLPDVATGTESMPATGSGNSQFSRQSSQGSSKSVPRGSLQKSYSSPSLSRQRAGGQAAQKISISTEVTQLLEMGGIMKGQSLQARWTSNFHKPLYQQGEEMLAEMVKNDEVRRFKQKVSGDDMRPCMALNISARLRDEMVSGRATQQSHAHSATCSNIRKNLNTMMGQRRDLTAARMKMMTLVNDETEEQIELKRRIAELGMGCMSKTRNDEGAANAAELAKDIAAAASLATPSKLL